MTTPIDHLQVFGDISPNDEMFTGDRSHYFRVGESALDCIRRCLDVAGIPFTSVECILDLPCGHGRVLRHLRACFPGAKIVATDLLGDGVDYCARQFGACPAYATEDPMLISYGADAFDLIWVGSLFTHLDAPRWTPFLNLFRRSLRPGGVLVFTTHGRTTYDWMVSGVVDYGLGRDESATIRHCYEREGFGYAHYSEARPYGHSLSSAAWVINCLGRVSDMRLVHFSERSWDHHQDVYACVRGPLAVDHFASGAPSSSS